VNWTPETIIQIVVNLGVIPGLFVWLLTDTRKDSKKREEILHIQIKDLNEESTKRQTEWIEHMTKSDIMQQEFLLSLKEISRSQTTMEKDIEILKERKLA
jgi:transcriptional regulator of met regulon